tara:strand:+ start:2752 stop:3510 length:759 start_codon:yes stop_codon:yes gene_type:complete
MRLKIINDIRRKMEKGLPSVGTWQQISSSSISEILGNSGYDWVALDLEHGSISSNEITDMFRAFEMNNVLSLARVAQPNANDCKLVLDAGAGGVIVPMIDNHKQLKNIVNACCWPPKGNRGVGFSRANLFGKNFENYKKEAQAPLIVAQIENINALNNLSKILNVDGLDAIIIGPYDLTASMGITGNFSHEDFKKVRKEILNLCQKYNIPCGEHIVEPNPELLKQRIQEGFRFLAYSIDAVILNKFVMNPLK